MSVLLTCVCVYYVPAWYCQKSEEGVESLGTRIPNSCELPGRHSVDTEPRSSKKAEMLLNCSSHVLIKKKKIPLSALSAGSVCMSVGTPGVWQPLRGLSLSWKPLIDNSSEARSGLS